MHVPQYERDSHVRLPIRLPLPPPDGDDQGIEDHLDL